MRKSIILSPTIKHIYLYMHIYAGSYIVVVSKIKRLIVCAREVYIQISVCAITEEKN